jgi:hypothetical protein
MKRTQFGSFAKLNIEKAACEAARFIIVFVLSKFCGTGFSLWKLLKGLSHSQTEVCATSLTLRVAISVTREGPPLHVNRLLNAKDDITAVAGKRAAAILGLRGMIEWV